MCGKLSVSTTAYYSYLNNADFRLKREESWSEIDREVLEIYNICRRFVGPKAIFGRLKELGKKITFYAVKASYKRLKLRPILKRKAPKTTIPDGSNDARRDLVKRNFYPPVCGSVSVGDITYLKHSPQRTNFYMSTVIDLNCRMLIGHDIDKHMTAEIVCEALVEAKTGGYMAENGIFHSDKGSQYTSTELARKAEFLQLRLSVGRTGSCYDNAVAESFFSIMKREIGWEFESYEEGVRIIEDWIYFYNYIRPHSSIGYKTPYEKWMSMNIKVIA